MGSPFPDREATPGLAQAIRRRLEEEHFQGEVFFPDDTLLELQRLADSLGHPEGHTFAVSGTCLYQREHMLEAVCLLLKAARLPAQESVSGTFQELFTEACLNNRRVLHVLEEEASPEELLLAGYAAQGLWEQLARAQEVEGSPKTRQPVDFRQRLLENVRFLHLATREPGTGLALAEYPQLLLRMGEVRVHPWREESIDEIVGQVVGAGLADGALGGQARQFVRLAHRAGGGQGYLRVALAQLLARRLQECQQDSLARLGVLEKVAAKFGEFVQDEQRMEALHEQTEKEIDECLEREGRLMMEIREHEKRVEGLFMEIEREEIDMARDEGLFNTLKEESTAILRKIEPELKRACEQVEQIAEADVRKARMSIYTMPQAKLVLEAVMALLGRSTEEHDINRDLLNFKSLLALIKALDRDAIPEDCVRKARLYATQEDFNPLAIKKQAAFAGDLCRWVLAMLEYHEAHKKLIINHKTSSSLSFKLEVTKERVVHL